ncbi:MAG: hypothetical protein QG670_689 [Thermoproteota archaeon]|nr:hypothetical protein [Thermoproteota archaeon]
MGELKVIGRSPTVVAGDVVEGEITFTWNKGNVEEIERAEKVFKEYKEKGWLAIAEFAGRKTQIFNFNPDLEKISLIPLELGG